MGSLSRVMILGTSGVAPFAPDLATVVPATRAGFLVLTACGRSSKQVQMVSVSGIRTGDSDELAVEALSSFCGYFTSLATLLVIVTTKFTNGSESV